MENSANLSVDHDAAAFNAKGIDDSQLHASAISSSMGKAQEKQKQSFTNKAKEMICLEPTMNRLALKTCLFGLSVFLVSSFLTATFFAPTTSVKEEQQTSSAVHLIISTTVFGTLFLQFLFHIVFSTCKSQTTSAVFGATIAFAAGLSHFFHLLGIASNIISPYGCSISLTQYAEWIVCVPLLVCMLGHILCINPSTVFFGAGLQFFCIVFGLVGSVIQTKVVSAVLLVISTTLLLPILYTVYIFCFKLSHLISPTQQKKIRAIGLCVILLWNLFPFIYLLGMLGILTDVWQQKLMMLCDLLTKAAFLTIMLVYHFQNTMLQEQTRLMAMEKASDAQKVFLRFVFHEVRVPFQSLLLGLEQLQHEEELKPFGDLLNILMSSAQMMNRVIDDVLSLSRLQDGRLKLHPVPFSLEQIVDSTIESLEKMITDKGIKVVKKIDKHLKPTLIGDPVRLSQIIANLLSNAVKFTSRGKKIFLTVNVCEQNDMFSFFCLKVLDQGIGISKKDQKILFTPFSQINPHLNQEGRGSGLGLSIVKHLVELHGGSIELKSDVGKGAEFSVKLKLPISKDPIQRQTSPDVLFSSYGSFHTRMDEVPSDLLSSGPKLSQHSSRLSSPKFHKQDAVSSDASSYRSNIPQLSSMLSSPKFHKQLKNGMFNSKRESFTDLEAQVPNQYQETSKDTEESKSPISNIWKAGPSLLMQRYGSQNKRILPACDKAADSEDSNSSRNKINMPPLVLVTDDSQSNRKMTSMILKKEGYQVEEACDGSEAVSMAQSKRYDLILMDNVMPIMNGVEATREILKFSNTHIIGLTGNCLKEDVKEFLAAGAQKVLVKPCNRQVIISEVTSVLETEKNK